MSPASKDHFGLQQNIYIYNKCVKDELGTVPVSHTVFLYLQKSFAHKSRVHGGRREANGAVALYGLGES